MSVRILNGDCRAVLKSLPAESVHCCVTSPPYFGLRDYGVDGQIGLEPTPDAFVAEMVDVFREVRRVLRADGVLFLNLGDSYWTSGPRQTGRNDTNRETPGGRGGSFRGGVRRAIACDTSDRAPEGSPDRDCLCGSLCGACRTAYRIGKSRSDGRLVSTLGASSSASIPERMGLPFARLPTSGSVRQGGRIGAATHDLRPTADHAGAHLPAALASTSPGSSRQRREGSRLSDQPSGCLVCGGSLLDCVQASVHTAECNCGTSEPASASSNLGTDASVSAYPHLTTPALKPKDLIGIPWRVAFALQADGWWLRSSIIWHKPNPMPESVTDRPTSAHENVFLLAKSERYFYDHAAVKEAAVSDHASGNGYDRAERVSIGGRGQAQGWSDVGGLRNIRNVWTVATQPFSEAHFATFPPDLIEPCIKAGCPAGGTVLDPFGGAGTTGLVADRLGRDALLIELNPEYAAMARRRIEGDAGMFAGVHLEAAE